jgi:endoglucanase
VANLPGFGPMLLPGTAGFHPAPQVWVLNPSYQPLPVLERLARTDGKGPWAAIARELPAFLEKSSPHGFAMDWVSYSPASGFRPVAAPGEAKADPSGSFDAIRVYLWAGTASTADPESKAVLSAVGGMGAFLKAHLFPPTRISSTGVPGSGDGPVGFSAAVVPYLTALGDNAALGKQQDRLAAQLDPAAKLYGHPATYYDQNLAMFGEGWQTHRFRFDRDGELRVTWKK